MKMHKKEIFAILRLCLKYISNRGVGCQKLPRVVDNYVTGVHEASSCAVWYQHKRLSEKQQQT